jgi:hypothetical protein
MSSCSHYKIVDLGAFPYKNLYINNISNQSFAPNAQILFNSQLRQRLLEKGNIRLVNEPSLADCQLFVEMVDYKRSPLSQANDDPGRINAMDYTLSVLVSIYDNKEDTFLVEAHRLQSTEPLIYTQSENTVLSDIKEAEYRSIPRITNDLASQITDLIYGNW